MMVIEIEMSNVNRGYKGCAEYYTYPICKTTVKIKEYKEDDSTFLDVQQAQEIIIEKKEITNIPIIEQNDMN